MPGLRTLDSSDRFPKIKADGKGAGGLRGLAPWRSMRQRLMARFGAPAFSHPAMPSAPALTLTLTQWLSGGVGISSESQVVVVWFPPRFHTQYDDRVSRSCTKRFRILIAALL